VVTGEAFTNPLSSMGQLYFETFTDPEDGLGWHKMFLDNFNAGEVPEPGTALLMLLGAVGSTFLRRRRE